MSIPISDNKPKSSISEDLLHRKELIDSLSNLISSYDDLNSLTIGICGAWGSGKTSIINFVREKLQNNESIYFIDFNPWLYSSQENLASQFLRCMSYHFTPRWRKFLYRHSSCIHTVSNVSTTILPDFGLSRTLKVFSDLVDSNTNGIPLETLKSNISEKLKKSNHKIVIVIDDVDRLDPSEIRMLMKLVRSTADFSNTIYILCYDDNIVESALSTEEYSGHDYLQKIINLPIKLPEVSSFCAVNNLRDHYYITVDRAESNDYENSIFRCFSGCELTLRDVNIISSKFQLLFEISKNNTCPIDLLALIFLEVKDPSVYKWISENRLRLCGADISAIQFSNGGKWDDPSQTYCEMNLNPVYIDLLSLLFPHFKQRSYVNLNNGPEYRICQSDYINNYFLLTPSSLDITDEMICNFIRIDNPDFFFEVVLSLNTYHLYEIVSRACRKMNNNPEYADNLRFLSNIVMIQPFSDKKSLPIQCLNSLSKIVKTYLDELSDSEKIDYLKSSFPKEDIHKIILYGMIIDRMKGTYFANVDDSRYTFIYRMIFDELTNNPEIFEIIDSFELFSALILISRTDSNVAKQIFLKLKPTFEERKLIYEDLANLGLSSDFLTEMVGDPTHYGF